MIEWMQTHRKWLVITIWIATIAFIGAGFVGWGQFQFGKKDSTIAKINDTEVTIKDVQKVYNNLFEEMNKQFGGNLDDATAEKLGLKKQAFEIAIQQGVLREFAKNVGLYVTDEDVAKAILNIFKDKKTYKLYLKQSGLKAKDFEEDLKKELLIQKLTNAINLEPSNTLLLSIGSALYNSDNLKIKVIKKSNINVDLNESEIKAFWQENKNRYQTKPLYKVAIIKTPFNKKISQEELKKFYEENKNNYKNEKGEILSFEDAKEIVKKDYLAKITKKEAIIAYKKLKEGKENFTLITIPLNNNIIPIDKMQTLIQNGYLKPFISNNEYISAKLIEEIPPKPMSYKEAKEEVIKELLDIKTLEALNKKAKEELKNFKGKETGFITKYDGNKIKELNIKEATEFLFTAFSLEKSKNYLLIPQNNPNKAVLYKVLEQKMLDKEKYEKNKEQIKVLAQNLLNTSLIEDLIKDLMNKYHIVSYVKEKN